MVSNHLIPRAELESKGGIVNQTTVDYILQPNWSLLYKAGYTVSL